MLSQMDRPEQTKQDLTINSPEKNSNPRMCKVSLKLVGILNALPHISERIFHVKNGKTAQLCLSRGRKRAALKLQNPRLSMITHHTLRYWKGTTACHETHDVVHVQQLLGHKNIQNTAIYIMLETGMFQTKNDDFHVAVAKTLDDVCKLLEVGFEYVCDMNDAELFRKRK